MEEKHVTLRWFEKPLLKVLQSGKVPRHIAFIMDGNRFRMRDI
jgi:undecaprenyl pyrophosphate synthase